MNLKSKQALDSIMENNIDATNRLINQVITESIQQKNFQECLNLASQFQQLGFIEQSEYICNQVLSVERLEPFLLLKSELFIDNNNIEDALDILLTIDESSPYYVDTLLIMADAYHLIDLDEVALHKLMIAKELAPDEPVIDLGLYELNFAIGNMADAFNALSRIKDTNIVSSSEYNKKISRLLLSTGEYEEAIHYLEQLPMEQRDSNTFFELGLAYFQLAEYARALSHFEKLITSDPDFQSAYLYLGYCLLELGQYNEGVSTLEHALENNPFDEQLYLILYEQYTKLHDNYKKEQLIKKAKDNHVDSEQLRIAYAQDLLADDNFEQVIDFAIESQQDSEYAEWDWILANAYAKLEDDANAQLYYKRAYNNYKDNIMFLEDYAYYLREIGQIAKVQTLVRQIEQLDPTSEFGLLEEFL